MKIDIAKLIQKLPINIIARLKLERFYIISVKKIKKLFKRKVTDESKYYPLVVNNRNFGDEFLLRRYAGIKEELYSIIEHGIYFGNNTQKTGVHEEWELGCILTNGEYRKQLINKYFPEYYCEMIGPMIEYAQVNKDYIECIQRKLRNGKTLLYFPIHGGNGLSPIYDRDFAFDMVLSHARKWKCKNIIICAFYTDYDEYVKFANSKKTDYRVIVETCGNRYGEFFLDYQKSLISISDYTISNSLGTHLGYCIYLNKPHVLLSQALNYDGDKAVLDSLFGKDNVSDNFQDDLSKEKNNFEKIFSESNEFVSEAQYKFCDYYWGFSKIKSPSQIKDIYTKCNVYSHEFVKKNRKFHYEV